MPLTMMQKRGDLQTYLRTLLAVHDTRFNTAIRVDITERRELEMMVDRDSRVKVTGGSSKADPIRYCSVHDIGQQAIGIESTDAAGNVECFIGHRFDVRIFWGKDYADSQDDFEAMVYNARDHATLPGILDTLRANRTRTVGTNTYNIGLQGGDAFLQVIRDSWIFGPESSTPDISHYLNFQTILVG